MTDQRPRFGEGEPRYRFVINPYPDVSCTTCPSCEKRTAQRKTPLLIHVDPHNLIALNYTCRYCAGCDLLIGKKNEIEAYLTRLFTERDPQVIGNDYLIIGTVEKSAWRKNMLQPVPPLEMLRHIHDFKGQSDLEISMAGWFPEDQEPPMRQPPPSTDWVKRRQSR